MFFLLIRDEGREPAVRKEVVAGMEIGRRKDLQCVLEDRNAGRLAARIVEERGKFYVEDLGSINRIAIRGGRKLGKGEREPLRHGMIIEIGRSTIQIEEHHQGPPRRPSSLAATESYSSKDVPSGQATIVGEGVNPSDLQVPAQPPIVLPVPAAPPSRAAAPVPPQRPKQPELPPAAPVPFSEDYEAGAERTMVTAPMSSDPAALATMLAFGPRLVIVNEADRRSVPLRSMVSVVGRKHGECTIDHPGISEPHAEIRFNPQTNSFQIADQGSKNNTFVAGLSLAPRVPQLLSPECLLHFGPINAVFVVDHDSENAPIPPQRYEAAVQILIAEHQVTLEQARVARERAKQGKHHVGEELMLASVVSARAWTKAFETARRFEELSPPTPPDRLRSRRLFILAGVLVGLLGLAWIFREQLGW